jgi:hypothetical protein
MELLPETRLDPKVPILASKASRTPNSTAETYLYKKQNQTHVKVIYMAYAHYGRLAKKWFRVYAPRKEGWERWLRVLCAPVRG